MLLLAESATYAPHILGVLPFVALLLAIAILPLVHRAAHWWEHNRNKLLVAAAFALVTLVYYGLRPTGVVAHAAHGHGTQEHAAHGHGPTTREGAAVGQSEPGAGGHGAGGQQGSELEAGTVPEAAHGTRPAGEHGRPPAEEGGGAAQQELDAAPAGERGPGLSPGPGDTPSEPSRGVRGGAAPRRGLARPTAPPEERTAPGLATVKAVLHHAVIEEFIPFMVLLFSLYVIAGGIVVRGDLRATPAVNTTILATGGVLASLIGTTGAAMVLIRFLLRTNAERKRKVHTVVFFIFIVANIGGSLLPIGDPPLFLGYLMGVDFLWTLRLWSHWGLMVGALLVIYYLWDAWAYRREAPQAIQLDNLMRQRLSIVGRINFLWILGVVLAVATLSPGKTFPGTTWEAPPHLREVVQLAFAGLSLLTTSREYRRENQFNYTAINEVACLFIGIFITMQVPIEILQARGGELGLLRPWQFFWATGLLSSFLDNAPTYVVYFTTAGTLTPPGMQFLTGVRTATGQIPVELLIAVSCGAVFMGANTYIGNGPNFMVKAIAEQSGVKMPSFFGYMAFSCGILIPLFVGLTFLFFRG